MRLSELFGRPVIDAGGTRVGTVKDVRLIQDGPYLEGFGYQFRVEGILVGDGALAVRLGMARAKVKGPWLLTAFFRRFEHRARYIDWHEVATNDAEQVRLKPGARLIDVAELEQTGA